jgi:hypothetical protein
LLHLIYAAAAPPIIKQRRELHHLMRMMTRQPTADRPTSISTSIDELAQPSNELEPFSNTIECHLSRTMRITMSDVNDWVWVCGRRWGVGRDNVLESVVDGNDNGVAACHGTGRWPAAEAATMVSTV